MFVPEREPGADRFPCLRGEIAQQTPYLRLRSALGEIPEDDRPRLRDDPCLDQVRQVTVQHARFLVDILQGEVDSYKKGGRHEGMFPERWLPSAIGICDEEFTVANKMMNSTSKIVRRKVEEHYASLLEYLYTAEGKLLHNERNLEALK